ncbi:uncharacterized protein LOC113338642 [Papaver somniferum]|uniref:uncharacterized protein LOC113338642 n=1 Tax=Papaver somniferum TaxID=3469 RepID=UPI000E703A28|nr:uncharacterized protein LOC113338642 [Papaver somniferum]
MAFPIQFPPARTIITVMALLNHLSTLENFIAAVNKCLKLRALHKNEKLLFTATNLLKLIGVRVFITVIISHLWAEFVLKKVEEKLGWTTFTSLFYSVIVIDVGLDRYALDTGFPEAAVMLSVRFIITFHKWELKNGETASELLCGKISFWCTLALKWIEPSHYVSLEVYKTHKKLTEIETELKQTRADLAELRLQLHLPSRCSSDSDAPDRARSYPCHVMRQIVSTQQSLSIRVIESYVKKY